MRGLVLFAAACAAIAGMWGAAPVAAQQSGHVDWEQFAKQAPGDVDVDWDRIRNRERLATDTVDWSSFGGNGTASKAASTIGDHASGLPSFGDKLPAEDGSDQPRPEDAPKKRRFILRAPGVNPVPQPVEPPQEQETLPPDPEPGPPAQLPPPGPEPSGSVADSGTAPPAQSASPGPQAVAPPPSVSSSAASSLSSPALPSPPVRHAASPADVALLAPPRPLVPDVAYSDAAVSHFLTLALFDKDVQRAKPGAVERAQVLVRWQEPMRVAIVGGDDASRRVLEAAVRAVGSALPAQTAGLALAAGGDANAEAYILDGDGGGIDGYTRNTYRDGLVITGARIVLYRESLTPAVARRELLRALGFTGCAPRGADSDLCCDGGQASSAGGTVRELDRLALKLLYHPALEPGFDYEHARSAVDALR